MNHKITAEAIIAINSSQRSPLNASSHSRSKHSENSKMIPSRSSKGISGSTAYTINPEKRTFEDKNETLDDILRGGNTDEIIAANTSSAFSSSIAMGSAGFTTS